MLKIKPQIWTRDDGKRYVMMSFEDFEAISDMIEDAGLSRILRASKKRQASSPTISHEELKRRLGLLPARKKKAG